MPNVRKYYPSIDYFDSLLTWLDPDQGRAARKYETIRRQLTKMFGWEQCLDAEDLADETINRVLKKVSEVPASYLGDPSRYFYGVARNVLLEHRRQGWSRLPIAAATQFDEVQSREQLYDCLDRCLLELPTDMRTLLLAYYDRVGEEKFRAREELAAEMGVSVETLRVRVHRAKASLEKCIDQCKNAKSEIQ